MHLYTLLDVLLSLQENRRKYWYPEDVNNSISDLIKKIEEHLHSEYKKD